MKPKLPLACSIILLLCALCDQASAVSAPTLAAAQHSLDITLDGPWIYHEDSYMDQGHKIYVIVAMAPAVAGHMGPKFTTGRATFSPSKNVFYCVAFDSICPKNTGNTQFTNTGDYPPLRLVEEATIPANKNIYDVIAYNVSHNVDGYYFVLPMPDYSVNGGVDRMKFSSIFGSYEKTDDLHTISLRLHYSSGPQNVKLYQCKALTSADICTSHQEPARASQQNFGTLELGFTNLEDSKDEGCDNHVRLAYHNMLLLLDNQPVNQGINKSIAYIDLPGEGEYSTKCYASDPQILGRPMPTMDSFVSSLEINTALSSIEGRLKTLESRFQTDLKIHADLGSAELDRVADELNQSQKRRESSLPERSESDAIKNALSASMDDMDAAYRELSKRTRGDGDASGLLSKQQELVMPFLDNLRDYQLREEELRNFVILNAKTGKDCKVVQLLVK
jgi:hypothetical protein